MDLAFPSSLSALPSLDEVLDSPPFRSVLPAATVLFSFLLHLYLPIHSHDSPDDCPMIAFSARSERSLTFRVLGKDTRLGLFSPPPFFYSPFFRLRQLQAAIR